MITGLRISFSHGSVALNIDPLAYLNFDKQIPSCSHYPSPSTVLFLIVGGGQLMNFQFFSTCFNLLAPPNVLKFWQFLPAPNYCHPSNLTESRWEKKYLVLVQSFQAVFLIQAGFIIGRNNMPFWLVLIISKAVEDPNLPFTNKLFV